MAGLLRTNFRRCDVVMIQVIQRLPSDALRVREGIDGSEPSIIENFLREATREHLQSVSVAINTFYPEIFGGYYLNRRIIAEIQTELKKIGVSIVEYEYFKESGIVPEEYFGTLVRDTEYVLIRDQIRVGKLFLWSFDVGGGSEFYKDALVMQFAVPPDIADAIGTSVEGFNVKDIAVTQSDACGKAHK